MTARMPSTPTLLPNLYLSSGELNPEALRRYRDMHGISREAFAELLGVTSKSVEKWEYGHRPNKANEEKIYLFCQATAQMMEDHQGFIPPHLRIMRLVEAMRQGKVEDEAPIIAYFRGGLGNIQALNAKIDMLSRELEEVESQHAEAITNVRAEARAELRRLREEIDKSIVTLA